MFGLLYEFPTITPVGIDASYPWRNNGKHCRESVCGFGIMDIGWGVEVFGMLPFFVIMLCFTPLALLFPSMSFGKRGRAERQLSL